MSFFASSAKIVGSASSSGLLQAYEHKEAGTQLFVVFSGISGADIIPSSKQVWEEFFVRFQQKQNQPLQNLQEVVSEVRGLYSQKRIELEVGACLVVDKVLYCVLSGGTSLYLLRGGQLINLSKTEIGSQRSLSGWLEADDIYFLVTKNAASLLSDSGALEISQQKSFDEVSEFLTSRVAQSQIQMQAVAALKISAQNRPVSVAIENKNLFAKKTARQRFVSMLDLILKRLPDPKMKIKSDTSDLESKFRRRRMPFIAVLLFMLLLISIGFGIKKRTQQDKRQSYEPQLTQAQHELSEAYSLRELNKSRAKELVLSARNTVESLQAQGIVDEQLDSLSSEISQSLEEIAGIFESETKLFLDLTLISSSYAPNIISYSDQTLAVLDQNEKRLVSVGLETKKTETVTDSEFLPDAKAMALWEDRSFVLSSDGVREVGQDVELLIKPDNWSASNVLIHAFAGNLYVLDKENGTIWRYSNLGLDATLESEWLAEDLNYDFSSISSWAIDGSIWILRENAVLRFNRGAPVTFKLDFSENVELSQIFTDEEADNLYLLDKSEAKILVFNKQGDYIAQYLSEDLKAADGFVVSEEFGKIIFLKEHKLYEIELN